MSRPKLLLELTCHDPQPWVEGDYPPLSKKYTISTSIRYSVCYTSNAPPEKVLADSIRWELQHRPELIDNMAKLLVEKMRKARAESSNVDAADRSGVAGSPALSQGDR